MHVCAPPVWRPGGPGHGLQELLGLRERGVSADGGCLVSLFPRGLSVSAPPAL